MYCLSAGVIPSAGRVLFTQVINNATCSGLSSRSTRQVEARVIGRPVFNYSNFIKRS